MFGPAIAVSPIQPRDYSVLVELRDKRPLSALYLAIARSPRHSDVTIIG
jgi:hypothetical protein